MENYQSSPIRKPTEAEMADRIRRILRMSPEATLGFIGERIGVTSGTVRKLMRKHGIKLNTPVRISTIRDKLRKSSTEPASSWSW